MLEVRPVFLSVNPRKVIGPDGVPSRALRSCADQQAEVYTNIFILSLLQAEVPTCFRKTTIIPIHKKTHATCLNSHRLIVLTSIIMKCFERLVVAHINSSLPACLNPLQFAYRHNRSTEDAISLTLHWTTKTPTSDSVDYSSIFNIIIPSRLISKLRDLGLSSTLCNWIISFLTHKPRSVRIERKEENTPPLYINGTEVERVESINFLRVTITDDLSWASHVDGTVKKAQQRLFFLRQLRKFAMFITSFTNFYRCTIESILSGCI
eukprot:g28505.t1